ncbi:MAG: MoxR family ATPase [Candidatus Scalindua rubra]|uniref:Methanol dehydrogenase regulatory protein n=1 Tax=Candidatus Scalindua brodae TaxID=237368 RepID=A0A0B0EMZ1_9BACT|nr:MAG: methanol dehydrogenase regulatory protein [Candidatus Scalindua brodae]MBZ0108934.1 MoxR family ATPase [Candidatus Scalindua rubra]TWU32127.1 Holliday junction ATP-dependent DNA helicase RuvB [Candidatus Brocadiaceae bacterium S225]
METEKQFTLFQENYQKLLREIQKVIVGQGDVINQILICLFTHGHILLEGVPGLGKTKIIKTLSKVLNLNFSRIQFTPDLMPADILGTNIFINGAQGEKSFQFIKGPIFSNIVLADEINRATPKTQSALLEAMQEGFVTISGQKYKLDEPFLVLATQNPIEMEGTFPLPEAQLDRFFFKVKISYPGTDELLQIVERTTELEEQELNIVIDHEEIMTMRTIAKKVLIPEGVKRYAINLVLATHPENDDSPDISKKCIRYGSSPRGIQSLIMAAKVKALLDKRYNVSFEDISSLALPALRHRIILNFEGQVKGLDSDKIISEIIRDVKIDK